MGVAEGHPGIEVDAVVAALGYVGRPRDGKPLILPATAPTGETPLTGSVVLEALCSLGIPKMTKPEQIELLYPVKPARSGYLIDLHVFEPIAPPAH